MTPEPVVTLARYRVCGEHAPVVLELLEDAAAKTRAEAGNTYFLSYREHDDPNTLVLLEGWDSYEALEQHRETAHFQETVLRSIAPLLESRTVTLLAPIHLEES
jgi:autoinducer 2-degrading protein